jgi:hypothetical protein
MAKLEPASSKNGGRNIQLNDRERDEIKWNCGAGPGLLTRYAPGEFTAVLRLQPGNDNSDRLDLGILRKPQDDSDVAEGHETWVPLIKNVTSLEITYYDPNQPTTWLPRWPGGKGCPRSSRSASAARTQPIRGKQSSR